MVIKKAARFLAGMHASFVVLAHEMMKKHLKKGDAAVDATVGNGNDTLFLAQTVGAGGNVYGFDIQERAITTTRRLLADFENVRLIQDCHSRMREHVPGRVAGVMFNLGFLPGSDKTVVTGKETTISALNAAMELLVPGGIITVVLYPGHIGGREEADAVLDWAEKHDCTYHPGPHPDAPSLIVVRRNILQIGIVTLP